MLLIAVPALVAFGGRADAGVRARLAGAPAHAAAVARAEAARVATAGAAVLAPAGAATVAPVGTATVTPANAAAIAPAGAATVAPAGTATVTPAGARTIAPAGAGVLSHAGQIVAPARQQPLFDPKADPAAGLKAAIVEARRTGRRIMLDVGGNWCPWCLVLHRYLHDDPALKAFVADHYVWVRVNYGPENKNEKFLSQYPEISGYPHLFVLDSEGKLLHSQDTSLLEQGNSYSNEKMWAFLRRWASGATGSSQRD